VRVGVRGRGGTGVRGLCRVGPVGGGGLRLHERNKNTDDGLRASVFWGM
jgi:hypothetical protein